MSVTFNHPFFIEPSPPDASDQRSQMQLSFNYDMAHHPSQTSGYELDANLIPALTAGYDIAAIQTTIGTQACLGQNDEVTKVLLADVGSGFIPRGEHDSYQKGSC